jgi:hypothetical protein
MDQYAHTPLKPKSGIQNPESGIQNPQPAPNATHSVAGGSAIRNPKSAIQNLILPITLIFLSLLSPAHAATPFTSITNGTSLQNRALISQIDLSLRERALACGYNLFNNYLAGTNVMDIQQASVWSNRQTDLQTLVTYYVDPEYTTDFANYVEIYSNGLHSSHAFWTVATWRTAASMDYGYRRCTNYPSNWQNYSDSAYMYGYCTTNDIVGPWLWVDLQNGLDKLKWLGYIMTPSGNSSNLERRVAYQAAFTNSYDSWATNAWASYGGSWFFEVHRIKVSAPDITYATRTHSSAMLSTNAVPLPYEYDATCWYLYYRDGPTYDTSPDIDQTDNRYEVGRYIKWEDFTDIPASNTVVTTDKGKLDGNPYDAPGGIGIWATNNMTTWEGNGCYEVNWIIKPRFTYQN